MCQVLQSVVFLLVVMVHATIHVISACSPLTHVTPTQVQIISPNFGFGKTYPPNSKCQWQLTLGPTQQMMLSFYSFDLEYIPGCIWDGVEIFHGNCSMTGPSILRHCGTAPPRPVTVENEVCVRFWSDDVGNKRGFRLSVYLRSRGVLKKTKLKTRKEIISTTTTTQTSTALPFPTLLGPIIVNTENTIESPNYGLLRYYPANVIRHWLINAPYGKSVVLHFESFSLELHVTCSRDYLSVIDGSEGSGQIVGTFCGHSIPDDVASSSSELSMVFFSDETVTDLGFSATITFVDEHITIVSTPNTTYSHSSSNNPNSDDPTVSQALQQGGIVTNTLNNVASTGLGHRVTTRSQTISITPSSPPISSSTTAAAAITITTTDTTAASTATTTRSRAPETTILKTTTTALKTTTPPRRRTSTTTAPSTIKPTHTATKSRATITKSATKTPATVLIRSIEKPNSPTSGLSCSTDGIVLNQDEGSIYSPGYGIGSYPKDLTCKWILKVPEYSKLEIQFVHFELESEESCRWDSLTIYNGDIPAEDNLIGRFCGTSLPSSLMSSTNVILIEFQSDRVTSLSGFLLTYNVAVFNNSGCGIPSSNTPSTYYVPGGLWADVGEFPWQVSIRLDDSHICGGAILDQQWVLTAAHCLDMIILSPYRVTIMTGSTVVYGVSESTQIVRAGEMFIHPSYRYAKAGDVGLIRILKPVRLDDYSIPLCLPRRHGRQSMDSLCVIAGWGLTKTEGGDFVYPSKYLHKANVKIWTQSECEQTYPGRITESMFCAGYISGQRHSCKGDSGGPLICQGPDARWRVIGVISWGGECGNADQPGVYTSLPFYVDWVRNITNPTRPTVTCTFEDASMCGYQDISRGIWSWRRRDPRFLVSGLSSISSTTGFYMYMDGPSGKPDQPAVLRFPAFHSSMSNCLSFSYAISENKPVKMTLIAEVTKLNRTLWKMTGQYQHDWRNTSVTVPSGGRNIRLVVDMEYFNRGLVAVDNVHLVQGSCSKSTLTCNFTTDGMCGYKQIKDSSFQWEMEKCKDVFNEYQLFADAGLQSSGSSTRLVSPLHQSKSPSCLQIAYSTRGRTGYLKIFTITQIAGGEFPGPVLKILPVGRGETEDKLTTTLDLQADNFHYRLVLEFQVGQERAMFYLHDIYSYNGSCIF